MKQENEKFNKAKHKFVRVLDKYVGFCHVYLNL